MKKVRLSSQEWGDPYPCGQLTNVYIGKEEVGQTIGADPVEIKQLVEKVYKLGFEDGRKEKRKGRSGLVEKSKDN
jgi:hypothetical protein